MSKIEWTDKTWNPIVGCSEVSEGCKNCYAEKMAGRLANINSTSKIYSKVVKEDEYSSEYRGLQKWNGRTCFNESALKNPFKWKKPLNIFVCSMSDLFHYSNSFYDILRVWDVMCQNPQHTFQILTKRPGRMLKFYEWLGKKCKNDGLDSIPSQSNNLLNYIDTPNHIWIGVTVENQLNLDKRIKNLNMIPARIKFVSFEPLLSKIDLDKSSLSCINWVISGPETGPGKREMKKEWLESLFLQCIEEKIPFFDKKNILGINLKQFPNER
jgi:protein gp37